MAKAKESRLLAHSERPRTKRWKGQRRALLHIYGTHDDKDSEKETTISIHLCLSASVSEIVLLVPTEVRLYNDQSRTSAAVSHKHWILAAVVRSNTMDCAPPCVMKKMMKTEQGTLRSGLLALLLGARTLLGASASLLVTSALLVVTRSY